MNGINEMNECMNGINEMKEWMELTKWINEWMNNLHKHVLFLLFFLFQAVSLITK